jgi:NADH-quinone oxidoreductase subunit J
MSCCLFADVEPARGLWPFLRENWLLLLPPALGFVAIYLLLPKARRLPALWGGAVAALALVLGATILLRTETLAAETLLFYAFSGIAILAGGMMITQSNPVHAALSFALVILSTCGLFLLQAAPFLMAATIIVYAGAIVVTFLFVIMLAQQEGASSADQLSREPFLAALAGCVLMASLVCILKKTYDTREIDSVLLELQQISEAKDAKEIDLLLGIPRPAKVRELTLPLVTRLQQYFTDEDAQAATEVGYIQTTWLHKQHEELKKYSKSVHAALKVKRDASGSIRLHDVPGKKDKDAPSHFAPGKLPANNVAALGRTLFTDYLVPVEMAAMLLLIATIGAIVIAGRRSEELR